MQPELIGGRYRVESAIGKGGMGTVWLCRDETLQRNVAVKQVGLLPNESVTDSARAFREARSTAALSHRNVVTVFDVVEESGHIWLVMEHVPGRSLSQIIKQDGPLDPGTVAEIGAQVAAGLAAAHAAGTMHRDVKPGNVLIREDGVAKISDFGIARTHGDPALTQSGFLTGTPSYFSPELARGGDPGPGTDVWALGATLYAAVEGHSPYEQRTNPVAVLHDITQGQPPHPQRADFLEPALQRMMDRDPESRWSMDDAAHVLRRLADQHKPESTLVNTLSGGAPAPAREVAHEEPSRSATAPAPRPSPTPVDSASPIERRTCAVRCPSDQATPSARTGPTRPGCRRTPARPRRGGVVRLAARGRPAAGRRHGRAGRRQVRGQGREGIVVLELHEGGRVLRHHRGLFRRGEGAVRPVLLREGPGRHRRGLGDARSQPQGAGSRLLQRLLARHRVGGGPVRKGQRQHCRRDPGLHAAPTARPARSASRRAWSPMATAATSSTPTNLVSDLTVADDPAPLDRRARARPACRRAR